MARRRERTGPPRPVGRPRVRFPKEARREKGDTVGGCAVLTVPRRGRASVAEPMGLVHQGPRTRGRRLTNWAQICRGERKSVRSKSEKKAPPPPPAAPPPPPLPAPTSDEVDHFDFFDALHAAGPLSHSAVVVPAVDLTNLSAGDPLSLDALLPELVELGRLPDLSELEALAEMRGVRSGCFSLRIVPQQAFRERLAAELGSLRKRRVVRVRLRPTGVGLHLGCGGAMKTANAKIGAGKC